jgi:ubiquitin-activating enzyme E1
LGCVWCCCCWLQVVQAKPIEAYRNTFANLALPLFAMAEPITAKGFEHKDLKWSIWDRWIIDGDKTVQVSATLKGLCTWLMHCLLNRL